jgi:DNA-binding cell septation regulator SpoVG
LIRGEKGYSVVMPRRKRATGKYIDIIAPIDKKTRQMIEERVFEAYKIIADEPVARRVPK